MKRYWVFAYETYYPCGGMNDFEMDTDDVEVAKSEAEKLHDNGEHVHIYDTENRERVSFPNGYDDD